jgi:hypothetical protein
LESSDFEDFLSSKFCCRLAQNIQNNSLLRSNASVTKKHKTEIISSTNHCHEKIFAVAAAIEIRATITAKDRRFNFFAGKLLHE